MRTTTALITNQVANEAINEKVVSISVRHAIALPPSCQNCVFSGSHFLSQAMLITPCRCGVEKNKIKRVICVHVRDAACGRA